MNKALAPTNTFQIAFDVCKKSGYINTVQVTLERGVMDSEDVARIDLCNHPLYPDLQDYVLANPVLRRDRSA